MKETIRQFERGFTNVMIVSDAASLGLSLHADKSIDNRKQRFHICMELGWTAERVIQQFGRTNRSNQVCKPIYNVVTTDIPGELRLTSSVTQRIEHLGCVTYGSEGLCRYFHLQKFNIFVKANIPRISSLLPRSARLNESDFLDEKPFEAFFNM